MLQNSKPRGSWRAQLPGTRAPAAPADAPSTARRARTARGTRLLPGRPPCARSVQPCAPRPFRNPPSAPVSTEINADAKEVVKGRHLIAQSSFHSPCKASNIRDDPRHAELCALGKKENTDTPAGGYGQMLLLNRKGRHSAPGNHGSSLFVYFCLHWVFVTLHGLSRAAVLGLLLAAASLGVSTGPRARRLQRLQLSGPRARAQEPWCMGLDAPQLWDLPRPRIESDRVRSNVSPALGDGDTWQLTKRRPRGKSRTNGADCRFSSLSRVGLNSQGVGETCSSSGDPVELLRRDDRHADEEPVVQRFREHLHGLLNSQQQASIQSG
ncbi:hypothetical protein R6Z07F_019598 [Ovis aries]